MFPRQVQKITALGALAFFGLIAMVHAQVPTLNGITLTTSADNPAPGQSVTVTAASYGIDISAARITWTVDGSTVQSGIGLNSVEVTAPVAGKQMTVSVSASLADGTVLTQSVKFGSGSVDLIVETDGYAPPYFPGKLPPVHQNSMKIIAMPHLLNNSGVEDNPKNLIYSWKEDGSLVAGSSGYGKQSLTLVGEVVPRSHDITVTVAVPNSGNQASAIMTLETQNPFIYFYVDDPVYGPMFNKAVGDGLVIGTQKETSVLAVPYGFNKPANSLGDLNMTWLVNSVEQTDLAKHQDVVLRAPANAAAGSSDVELDINNQSKILQTAHSSFRATFGSQKTSAVSI